MHDPDAAVDTAVGHNYIRIRAAQPDPDVDAVISFQELAELHALRRARESIIDWCDETKGPVAVLIRRILDDADIRQRLAVAGLSYAAIEHVLAGEEIAPGIRVLVDGDSLGEDDD